MMMIGCTVYQPNGHLAIALALAVLCLDFNP